MRGKRLNWEWWGDLGVTYKKNCFILIDKSLSTVHVHVFNIIREWLEFHVAAIKSFVHAVIPLSEWLRGLIVCKFVLFSVVILLGTL